MTLTITLSRAEAAFLQSLARPDETAEQVLHRILAKPLEKFGEERLQTLATQYRSLTPDQQVDAIALLTQWAVDNGIPVVTP